VATTINSTGSARLSNPDPLLILYIIPVFDLFLLDIPVMLIISSLRSGPNGGLPVLPTPLPKENINRPPRTPVKDHILMSPIKNKSMLKRLNSASMVAEPAWESSIQGSLSPDTRCKKLMHIRREGIPKHQYKGLVAQPVSRTFVTPSELNLLNEQRHRRFECNISVTSGAFELPIVDHLHTNYLEHHFSVHNIDIGKIGAAPAVSKKRKKRKQAGLLKLPLKSFDDSFGDDDMLFE
jgi:hypothetical protein